VLNPHVDAIPLPELFRGPDNQFFFRVDNPADVIRDPSGGKRGMGTPFEDDDVQLGTMPFCLGGGTHSRGITADDNKSFFGHGLSSWLRIGQYPSAETTKSCLFPQNLLYLTDFLLNFAGYLFTDSFGFQFRVIAYLPGNFLDFTFHFVKLPFCLVLRACFHDILLFVSLQ